MLSDPQTATVDGSARTMPRVATGGNTSSPRKVGQSVYRTSDGTYSVATRQFQYRDGSKRIEVSLGKLITDADPTVDVFTGQYLVSVGLTFETGPRGLGASEIAGLRTAMLAYVDSTLQNRLVAGEV
jgi:hypothetical protein